MASSARRLQRVDHRCMGHEGSDQGPRHSGSWAAPRCPLSRLATRSIIMAKANELGNRLREAREMAGLTQTAAAEALGMRRPSVSEIESGRRRVTTDELYKIADLYGVSADWLATGEGSSEL